MNSILADALNIHAIEIDSAEADKMRQAYDRKKQREERFEQMKSKPLEELPKARIIRFLNEFEQGNADIWWQINYCMHFDESGHGKGSEFDADFTQLIGWQEAEEETRRRLIDAAWKYIESGNPNNDEWLGSKTLHRPALSGFRALFYFAKYEPGRLDRVDTAIWKKWAAIIMTYPIYKEEEREAYQLLLKLAYERTPSELISALRTTIEGTSSRGETANSFHRYEHIVDGYFVREMLSILKSSELTAGSRIDLLNLIAQSGNPSVVAYAEQLWHSNDLTDADERNVAFNAIIDLLNVNAQHYWSIISPIFSDDLEAAKEFVSRLHRGYEVRSIINQLSEEQKADLYIWLERSYPYNEDPQKESSLVTEREAMGQFRDSVLRSLQEHGTHEACRQIRRIMNLFPESQRLKWALYQAKSTARRMTWEPLSPTDIFEVTRNSQKRLVRSEAELMDVVIESLERMEKKLHDEVPAIQFLWNETEPKPENDFSDWVKIHLDDDLKGRGVVANREVQIHRSKDRTDIHVNAVVPGPTADSYDTVRIIIEVKGSWHRDLKTAMQNQLVNQYFQDNQCTSGVYLVGWFNCDKWDEGDYRKKQAPKFSLKEAREFFDEQARALSGSGVRVRAYVVDAALKY